MALALRPEPYAQGLTKLRTARRTQRPLQWQTTLNASSTNLIGLYLWQSRDSDALELFKQRAHFQFLRRPKAALITQDFYRKHWTNSSEARVTFSSTVVDSKAHLPPVATISLADGPALLSYLQQVWANHPQLLQRPFLNEHAADNRQLLGQLKQQEPALRAVLFGSGRLRASTRNLEQELLAFLKQAVDPIARWQIDAAPAIRQMDATRGSTLALKTLAYMRQLLSRHMQMLLAYLAETLPLPALHYNFLDRKSWTFDQFLEAVDVNANQQFYDFLDVHQQALERAPDRRTTTSYLLRVSPTALSGYDDLTGDPVINKRLQGEARTPFTLSTSWKGTDSVDKAYEELGSSRKNVLYVVELDAKGRNLGPVFSVAETRILLPGTQLTVVNMRVMYHPLASAILLDEGEASHVLMIVLYCRITGTSLSEDVLAVRRFHEEQHALQSEAVLQALAAQHPRLQKTFEAIAIADGMSQWSGINTAAVCLSSRGVEARQALPSDTQLGIVQGRLLAWLLLKDDDRRITSLSFSATTTTSAITLYVDITDHLIGQVQHQWTWPSTRDATERATWLPFFANSALVKRAITTSTTSAYHFVWVTTRAVDAQTPLTIDHSVSLVSLDRETPFEWHLKGAPRELTDKLTTDFDLRSLAERSKIVWV